MRRHTDAHATTAFNSGPGHGYQSRTQYGNLNSQQHARADENRSAESNADSDSNEAQANEHQPAADSNQSASSDQHTSATPDSTSADSSAGVDTSANDCASGELRSILPGCLYPAAAAGFELQ